MKNILAIVALFAGSAIASTTSISDRELSLGGVALGDTEAHVLAIRGQTPKRHDTGEGIALQYPGLTVLVGWLEQQAPGKQRRVLQLTATGVNACTPSGICPGALVSKAVATYGQPISAMRESGNFLKYYSNQSSCWLRLGTSGGTIRSISAVCQP